MESERVVVAVEVDDTPWCATGSDLVADRLFGLGASAVSELPSDDGSGLRLVADVPVGALDELSTFGASFVLLEVDPTWNAGWRNHAVAVPVGDRLVVRPEWVAPRTEHAGRIEVVVDAADSFGSGSHPTTRLCLGWVERLIGTDATSRSCRVLDVGSGTGVLGVAALLLGAASLVAIDVEPDAVAATRRTAELNGVADRLVEVSNRSLPEVIEDHGPFDVVTANLLVPVIEALGSDLARASAPGGHLVLSGLLADGDQVARALSAVGAGAAGDPACALGTTEVTVEEGWAAVEVHVADA